MQKGFALLPILIIVPVLIVSGIWAYQYNFLNIRQIHSFYDCDNAGYKDPKSDPPVCITPNGQRYNWSDVINPSPITFVQPSSPETANWKTYINEKDGYSFKYPNTWEVKNPQEQDKPVIIGPTVAPCPTDTPTIHYSMDCEYAQTVIIGVSNNPQGLSVENYYEANLGSKVNYQEILIDNLKAKRTTEIPAVNENELVAINKDKKIYSISWIKVSFAKIIQKEEFEGIISTFKFLK